MEYLNIVDRRVLGINGTLSKIVKDFIKSDDTDKFIAELYAIENKIREEFPLLDHEDFYNGHDDRGLWFRFFEDDTAATTIRNLEIDLEPRNRNRDYILECIKLQSIIPFFS